MLASDYPWSTVQKLTEMCAAKPTQTPYTCGPISDGTTWSPLNTKQSTEALSGWQTRHQQLLDDAPVLEVWRGGRDEYIGPMPLRGGIRRGYRYWLHRRVVLFSRHPFPAQSRHKGCIHPRSSIPVTVQRSKYIQSSQIVQTVTRKHA